MATNPLKRKYPTEEKRLQGSTAFGPSKRWGGGARNVFGKAFQDAGFKWSKELCQADSDGDGQSNGFELGDPDCCWNAGDTPKLLQNFHILKKHIKLAVRRAVV